MHPSTPSVSLSRSVSLPLCVCVSHLGLFVERDVGHLRRGVEQSVLQVGQERAPAQPQAKGGGTAGMHQQGAQLGTSKQALKAAGSRRSPDQHPPAEVSELPITKKKTTSRVELCHSPAKLCRQGSRQHHPTRAKRTLTLEQNWSDQSQENNSHVCSPPQTWVRKHGDGTRRLHKTVRPGVEVNTHHELLSNTDACPLSLCLPLIHAHLGGLAEDALHRSHHDSERQPRTP